MMTLAEHEKDPGFPHRAATLKRKLRGRIRQGASWRDSRAGGRIESTTTAHAGADHWPIGVAVKAAGASNTGLCVRLDGVAPTEASCHDARGS
jgi:hypothetical protein